MSDVAIHHAHRRLLPGFVEKLLMWATWILAGTLFFSLGWKMLAPADPHGAVSLLAHRSPLAGLVQVGALAALTAAAAAFLVGRQLPDAGPFAAAVGLVALSVRGETVSYFLIRRADGHGTTGGLSVALLAESLAWFGVIALTILVGHVLANVFPAVTTGSGRHYLTQVPAGVELFRKYSKRSRAVPAAVTPMTNGLLHTVLVAAIGLIAFRLFSSGLASRALAHGQACFVVAAAMIVACYFAHRLAPVSSSLWSVGGALLLTLVAYFWSGLGSNASVPPASIPAGPFLRVLPIQYAAMGSAAAIAMCWYMRDPDYGAAFD